MAFIRLGANRACRIYLNEGNVISIVQVEFRQSKADQVATGTGKRFFLLLEGMRGVAALLVVLLHIPHFLNGKLFPVAGLAVDVFFVLSGAVIANAYEDRLITGQTSFRSFAKARLIRIYPLYLIFTLVGLASLAASGHFTLRQLSVSGLLSLFMLPYPFRDMWLYPLNFPTWSLLFEFVANFAYAALIGRASNRNLALVVAISLVILLACGLWSGAPVEQLGWTRRSFPIGFARVSATFFLGVLIFRWARPRLDAVILGNGWAVAVLVATAAVLMQPVPASVEWIYCLVATALVLPGLVAVALFVRPTNSVARLAKWLGETSFPVYVFHVPLYQVLDLAIGKRAMAYAPWGGMVFLGTSAVLGVFVNRHLDTPLREHIQSRIKGRRMRQAAI